MRTTFTSPRVSSLLGFASEAALPLTWPARGIEVRVVLGAPRVLRGCGGTMGRLPPRDGSWPAVGRATRLSHQGGAVTVLGPCCAWAQGLWPCRPGGPFKVPAYLADCVAVGSLLGPLPLHLFL